MMLSKWWYRLRLVLQTARQHGVWMAFRSVVNRLNNGPSKKIDIFDHYSFIENEPIKPSNLIAEAKTINWFVPDFNVGSGGHLNIFRFIWHLEKKGYKSRIIIVNPAIHFTSAAAHTDICKNFFPLDAEVFIGLNNLPRCEFAIATGWDTAYAVRRFQGANCNIYFVQDYEPDFFPIGTDWQLAKNTYDFNFYGITAGSWLATKLATDHGMSTHAVGFGVEHNRYQPTLRREPQIKRVFFYARPPTPRRAFELGLLVLERVSRALPSTQFILAGWDTKGYEIPFPHLGCGTLGLDELPDLYSQCDVALVLSLTNASLLPLELMACGCAVVSNKGDNVEWLLNEDVARLASANTESLSEAIIDLLMNDVDRQALVEKAFARVANSSWKSAADDFERGLENARQLKVREVMNCVA